MTELTKRAWWYVQPPQAFEMANCPCGNHETQWSEFEKHLWCEQCQKDFIPEHAGIFDSPIPINLCRLMGLSFDRINAATHEVEYFHEDSCKWFTLKAENEANPSSAAQIVEHTP